MDLKYLEPVDDGLPARPSREHTKLKLNALRRFIYMFTTAMKDKWEIRTYIDLLAGPGKVTIDRASSFQSAEFHLGSPLIALTTDYPFTHYWFVEKDENHFEALEKRVSSSQIDSRIKIINNDCNVAVDDICREIESLKGSINMAFLDPEGLELPWNTIEKLAKIDRMDLIVLFSTSGFLRNVVNCFENETYATLDRVFGGTEWRNEFSRGRGQFDKRRMIEYYKGLFKPYGYRFKELPVKNSKNAELYRLIGGGKHHLAVEFWEKSVKGAENEIYGPQTKFLPGIEELT